MSMVDNTNMVDNTLRSKYKSQEIFRIGDVVTDIESGNPAKILDRGSNYVTVVIGESVKKKWLTDLSPIMESKPVEPSKEFIFENTTEQIKLFGYTTENFDSDVSELLIEQFSEFDDLYSKHQIVKCLDLAMGLFESDMEKSYDLLSKVQNFYSKQNQEVPFIVEAMKTDIERKRISEIIATVAGVTPSDSDYKTVTESIKALREKYKTRQQWEVLHPFFQLAKNAGIGGIPQNLPYDFTTKKVDESIMSIDEESIIYDVYEENLDLLLDDLIDEDITESFEETEFINEVLSIETRTKLARKMGQRENILDVRKARAMATAANSTVLMQRARKLAETMLKRRMFKKSPEAMTRQEKERFEAGEYSRRALVAKLAQRLVSKVRMLQDDRLHHTQHAVTHTSDTKASNQGAS